MPFFHELNLPVPSIQISPDFFSSNVAFIAYPLVFCQSISPVKFTYLPYLLATVPATSSLAILFNSLAIFKFIFSIVSNLL